MQTSEHQIIFYRAIDEIEQSLGVVYPMSAVIALAAPNFWRVYEAVNGDDGIYCARPGMSLEECKTWLMDVDHISA